jgi:hypothetical protein
MMLFAACLKPTTSYPPTTYTQKYSAIKFSVVDAAGRPVAALCPGAAVTVSLSFPQPRLAFLSASDGSFAKVSGGCATRVVIDRTKGYAPATTQTAAMTVPCTAAAPITLKVTSAAGASSPFRTASATLPVNPRCKAATCAASG